VDALIASGIALTCLFLSIMLGKKDKLSADKFLIFYLSFSAIRQIYLFVETHGWLNESYWMIFGKSHYLLNAPIFFFYVYAITQQKPLKRIGYLLVLAPFIAYSITFLYYYSSVFENADLTFINGLMYINGELSLPWAFFVGLFLVIDPIFIAWYYILLRAYKKRVADAVSYADTINLSWLTIIFNIWFVSAVLLLPLSMLSVAGVVGLSVEFTQAMVEVASVAFFFVLGYFGFKQTAVFSHLDLKVHGIKKESPTISYERSGLTETQAQQYHKQLLSVMEEKKPYLTGELSAADLARQLGVSVNHLSQVLNMIQKQNFFDFVNSYRVKEVIEKMKDSKNHHLTLLALALDSGFNSKTSFNTVFKKFTGETPSKYFQSLKAQNA
jgi:AraC-like DNA-binding protein